MKEQIFAERAPVDPLMHSDPTGWSGSRRAGHTRYVNRASMRVTGKRDHGSFGSIGRPRTQ